MRTLLLLAVTAGMLSAAVPSTPSGHIFSKWLKAHNSGERARIEEFLFAHLPQRLDNLSDELALRGSTGGFELKRISCPDPYRVVAELQERSGAGRTARLEFQVEPRLPYRIVNYRLTVGTDRDSESGPVRN